MTLAGLAVMGRSCYGLFSLKDIVGADRDTTAVFKLPMVESVQLSGSRLKLCCSVYPGRSGSHEMVAVSGSLITICSLGVIGEMLPLMKVPVWKPLPPISYLLSPGPRINDEDVVGVSGVARISVISTLSS